jgi:sialic acid synthase SpsE
MRTFVIAECGSAHEMSRQRALALISEACEAGCDCAKFQLWSDAEKLAERRHAPELAQVYSDNQLPAEWLPELHHECERHKLAFMCTTYLPEDVAVVAPFVRHFKIASFEAAATDLVEAHVPFLEADRAIGHQRWLIISRGMGAEPGATRLPYRLLHMARFLLCTSAYPSPLEHLNLGRLRLVADDTLDGFSDHSDPMETLTGALAVAAGATIVEAHLRLYDTDPANPDFPHSMTPGQFQMYVQNIRLAETVLGDGREQAQPSEEPMMKYRVVR